MDERGAPAYREPPRQISGGGDRGRLQLLIVLVVGALVIQAIRPWGNGASRVTRADGLPAAVPTRASSAAPTRTRVPAVDPGPADGVGLSVPCGSMDSWRATTLQLWPGRALPIRSWIAIEPVEAAGPLDDAIPFAPVAADKVTAIGFCAPLEEAIRPPVAIQPSLWRVGDGRAVPLVLVPANPADHDPLRGLWRPPSTPDESGGGISVDAWPPGRYVIELASPSETYVRWLGVEIVDLGGTSSPSWTPSPVPGGTAALSGRAAFPDAQRWGGSSEMS